MNYRYTFKCTYGSGGVAWKEFWAASLDAAIGMAFSDYAVATIELVAVSR